MPEDRELLLRVENLCLSPGSGSDAPLLVDDLSFSVRRGGSLGIAGESGSGKTLTCLSIMRLLPPAIVHKSGEILFTPKGKEPIQLGSLPEFNLPRIRGRQIAMVFQDPLSALNPVFTCGKQVEEVISRHFPDREDPKKSALKWLEKVKLNDPKRIYKAFPWQLSGGQRQRVMIAIALAGEPELLIADEPTSALDAGVQRSILELLKELGEQSNFSMVFVSHDLAVLEEMAEWILVMRKGTLVEEGKINELLKLPQEPYTKALIACRPFFRPKLKRLPVMGDFLRRDPETGIIAAEVTVQQLLDNLKLPLSEVVSRQEDLYSKKPMIRVEDLSTVYRSRDSPKAKIHAVRGVTFEVYQKEILGLVGESGSGKTSLAKTILGLEPAAGGKVWFEETDVLSGSGQDWRSVRKHWQIIFQDPLNSLNPRFTAGEAILEPILFHKICPDKASANRRVETLLFEVQLDIDFAYRYPHQLSGGERQRICLARALASNPDFLICDEPVSALDVSVQAEILNLIRILNQKEGLTCLFIAHDLSVVRSICDRVMVMKKGELVEVGLTEKILSQPGHVYTSKLIDALPGKGYF